MRGWNPWRELRARQHIEFALVAMPPALGGGLYWPEDGWAAILIDQNLDPAGRRAALTHELIHDEQGGGCHWPGAPETWRARVVIDEYRVDEEVARRLVPVEELRTFCEARDSLGIVTTLVDAAEEFDVPEAVAARALRALLT